MSLKVLQIGSGSMGTRRLRDMTSRGDVQAALLEAREDRRRQAGERFGIPCFAAIGDALAWGPDALTISTPPHTHAAYVEMALRAGIHVFSEAELFPYPFREVERATADKGIVAAPSCTLRFLPVCEELKRVIAEELGTLHAYSYCLSTDTASWHPGEGPEYYARHRNTNGAREMVPFELTMLSGIFGRARDAAGIVRRGGELGEGYEDTWSLQMRLDNGAAGQMTVLGASPQTWRKGAAIGANGIVEFDFNEGVITRCLPKPGMFDTRHFGTIGEVIESVYKKEIDTFIEAVQGRATWPHDYRTAAVVAGTLAAAEKSAVTGKTEPVNPELLPAAVPDQYGNGG